MRSRNIQVKFCLNDEEFQHLNELCEKVKLSKSDLLRFLLLGYKPIVPPPIEYKKLITEMRMIGNNINQLVVIARSKGILNTERLEKHITALDDIEDEMRDAFNFKKRDKRWQ